MGPVIGITLDGEEQGEYSDFPYYALRQNYFEAVASFGGVPLALPQHPELAESYLQMIDGLIITGGQFDIDPRYYGEATLHETVTTKDRRTAFEFAITKAALKRSKPLLGICGGEQLINVVLGGSLVQDIAADIEGALEHEVKDRLKPAHDITITSGSLLHRIINQEIVGVNTSHHQSVKAPGEGVAITATTSDGVVEAIEYDAHPFCLGVQWHPEYQANPHDKAIMKAFVEACRTA